MDRGVANSGLPATYVWVAGRKHSVLGNVVPSHCYSLMTPASFSCKS